MALALASENGTDMTAVRARRSHRAQPRRARRRRWPIVTTSLVVLLAVVIGGGYAAWRWSQNQYYVGADSKGQVVHLPRRQPADRSGSACPIATSETGIKLAQVPPSYQQTVKATDAASNLSGAQAIVANIAAAVATPASRLTPRSGSLGGQGQRLSRPKAAVAVASKQHKKPGHGQAVKPIPAPSQPRPGRHVPAVHRIRHRGRCPRPAAGAS